MYREHSLSRTSTPCRCWPPSMRLGTARTAGEYRLLCPATSSGAPMTIGAKRSSGFLFQIKCRLHISNSICVLSQGKVRLSSHQVCNRVLVVKFQRLFAVRDGKLVLLLNAIYLCSERVIERIVRAEPDSRCVVKYCSIEVCQVPKGAGSPKITSRVPSILKSYGI